MCSSDLFSSQVVADYGKKDAEYKKANPEPRATVQDVANHIDHIKKVAGIDHIGLGGDFDGIESVVQGLEDTSKYPNLIVELLKKRGVDARTVSVPGASPMVFGEVKAPGATRMLVFYVHYDGQPLDPAEWTTPPFTPTLRTRPLEQGGTVIPLDAIPTPLDPESRLYARSASDDKAPIIALLTALDALKAAGLQPRSNIKFAFEGEEEAGSTNIAKILAANKALFTGEIGRAHV